MRVFHLCLHPLPYHEPQGRLAVCLILLLPQGEEDQARLTRSDIVVILMAPRGAKMEQGFSHEEDGVDHDAAGLEAADADTALPHMMPIYVQPVEDEVPVVDMRRCDEEAAGGQGAPGESRRDRHTVGSIVDMQGVAAYLADRAGVEDPLNGTPIDRDERSGVRDASPTTYAPASRRFSGSPLSVERKEAESERIRAERWATYTHMRPPTLETSRAQSVVQHPTPRSVVGKGHMSGLLSPSQQDVRSSDHRPWSTVCTVDERIRREVVAAEAQRIEGRQRANRVAQEIGRAEREAREGGRAEGDSGARPDIGT
ncbi:hypothetical protein CBR_g51212 [Chara braunii]|uniref:Uncharacterized protein n=1 Tax=Chara braunii TaxID=69332 RepID=A0A388M884_CHABU|nr:hypothetical protein CBR_g51212 [Chara braunii]|eukprot:GBG90703.1 hypothetical protein CBR_g51212 [Chara braunii]